VLFADLKGSMELLAARDPEEARKLLDPVLERMMEAVHHYEGTVNQVMGTGLWRSSAPPSPWRTMPSAPATPLFACRSG
jgi:class 3 adenylate cyclase